MSDRFRDLEVPGRPGRKDAVLLATVSSFEAMIQPTRHDLQQFSDLFLPLFDVASADARRMAAAALSHCAHTPRGVACAIIEQPIAVAAPFLVHAPVLDEEMMTDVVRRFGTGHARAIGRRHDLPAGVVSALASLEEPAVTRALVLRNLIDEQAATEHSSPAEQPSAADGARALREKLRAMVMHDDAAAPPAEFTPLPRRVAPDIEERLIRHAQEIEPLYFTTALADALGSSYQLAERIMLDVSGRQLSETLVALGLRYTIIVVALERFFPHLARGEADGRRSLQLLRSCAYTDCLERVSAWLKADRPARSARHVPLTSEGNKPRPNTRKPETPANRRPYSGRLRKA